MTIDVFTPAATLHLEASVKKNSNVCKALI